MTTVDDRDVATVVPRPRPLPLLPLLSSHVDPHETPAPRTAGDHLRRAAAIVASTLAVAFLAAAAVFAATGGHWFVIRTPSMGTAAPVGTLVLTRPTTVADLHVGDVVAFHPTDAPALTYTHRIVAVSGGAVTTRGDINGSDDPWRTTDAQLVGKVTVILPGLGFLARALPLLLIGGLLVVGLTRWWLSPNLRGPIRMIAFTVLYAVATVIVKPFVGLVQLETTNGPDGAAVTAASTGLLPIRISPLAGHGTGNSVHLTHGEVGTVHFSGSPADGRYALMAHVDLSWTGWVLLALVWLLPVLWVIVVGFRRHRFPAFAAGLPAAPTTAVGALA